MRAPSRLARRMLVAAAPQTTVSGGGRKPRFTCGPTPAFHSSPRACPSWSTSQAKVATANEPPPARGQRVGTLIAVGSFGDNRATV